MAKNYLDIGIALGQSLLDDQLLNEVQMLLREIAPRWTSGLGIHEHGKPRIGIDVRQAGALGEAVKRDALKRGPRYEELVRTYGAGPYERSFGFSELRGADRSLIVILHLDEWIFQPSSGDWLFANWISLQVRAARVEGVQAAEWSRRSLELLCERLSPIWAQYACGGRI